MLTADEIVRRGYCVGCGGCATVMGETAAGAYEPQAIRPGSPCPFSGAHSEDALAEARFGSDDVRRDRHVGVWKSIYAGHVVEGDYRAHGSSGGFAKWLLGELLRRGHVDAVVQVYATGDPSTLYRYEIATTVERTLEGARSAYYPVHFADVLATIRSTPRQRYAFVGVPCFVKAIRELCREDSELDARVAFTVGILCGQMKTKRFAEALANQLGIAPGQATAVDFRGKYRTAPPMNFMTRVADAGGKLASGPARSLATADRWDIGTFKVSACEICDDVFAETADIAVGDAWFGKYRNDPRGNNLVVTRHPVLDALVREAQGEGRLALDAHGPKEAIASQIGAVRHRQLAMASRIPRLSEPPPRRWATRRRSTLREQMRQAVRLRISRATTRWYEVARRNGHVSTFVRKLHDAKALVLAVNFPLKGTAAAIVALLFRGLRPLERLLPEIFDPYPRSRPLSILLQPSSPKPGNLGDHAMLGAVVQQTRARGMACTLWLPWWRARAADFGLQGVRTIRLPLAVSWRFDRFCFVGADTIDGRYDRGWRLWLTRWHARRLPCLVLNSSLRADVPPKAARRLADAGRRGATFFFRGAHSLERGARLGIEGTLTADVALLFEAARCELPANVIRFLAEARATGAPVAVLATTLSSYTGFVRAEVEASLEELQRSNVRFVVIQHDKRDPSDAEGMAICQRILGANAVSWVPPSADAVSALAEATDFACTSRMHLALALLRAGKPAVVLEYNDKARETLEPFGLVHLVAAAPSQLPALVDDVVRNLAAYQARVKTALPDVLALVRRQFLGIGDPLSRGLVDPDDRAFRG